MDCQENIHNKLSCHKKWGYTIKLKIDYKKKFRYLSLKICKKKNNNKKMSLRKYTHNRDLCCKTVEKKMPRNMLIGVVICQVWLIKCRRQSLRIINSYDKVNNVIKFSASQDTKSPWPVRSETDGKRERQQKRARQHEIKEGAQFFSKWDIYSLQEMITSRSLWLMETIKTNDELEQMVLLLCQYKTFTDSSLNVFMIVRFLKLMPAILDNNYFNYRNKYCVSKSIIIVVN